MTVSVAAIDLGASSGRVIVGDVGADHLVLRAAGRFPNDPVHTSDGLHWDASELFRQVVDTVRRAVASSPDGLASVAVDSWAVDYGLLRSGRLLAEPFHYRDDRNARGVERVAAVVPAADLYRRNGLQFLPFNTVYQLAADAQLGQADRILLIPDLIGFWLTGRMVTERTNASTTGLLDATSGQWDTELMRLLGLSETPFAELVDAGTRISRVSAEISGRIGAPGLTVTAVGSHDTASAVVGVPMQGDRAAYISCGTWGLVGLELEAPVITEAARAANFTNERGVDGRTRFLTNVMGTWLISETLREWERGGTAVSLAEVLRAAADFTGEVTIFNVQDPRFIAPGDMPTRIAELCVEQGRRAPDGRPALMRSIIESIAQAFADSLATAERLSGRSIEIVHVVGGGSLNRLLCQTTANRSGRPVLAGPAEATAIGNVLIQARAVGAISGSLGDLRGLIAQTQRLVWFEPRAGSRHD